MVGPIVGVTHISDIAPKHHGAYAIGAAAYGRIQHHLGKGFATEENNFGTSDEYHKFKHLPFPIDCDAELEIVTNGKTQKTQIVSLKPVQITGGKSTKAD